MFFFGMQSSYKKSVHTNLQQQQQQRQAFHDLSTPSIWESAHWKASRNFLGLEKRFIVSFFFFPGLAFSLIPPFYARVSIFFPLHVAFPPFISWQTHGGTGKKEGGGVADWMHYSWHCIQQYRKRSCRRVSSFSSPPGIWGERGWECEKINQKGEAEEGGESGKRGKCGRWRVDGWYEIRQPFFCKIMQATIFF